MLLLAACAGGAEAPTPKQIIEANAVQIFVREAYKSGWFDVGDRIELTSEALPFEQTLAKAQEQGLQLYRTLPGTPPYPGGLQGWLVTARGDFYDVKEGQTAAPRAPRRPGIAMGFVDRSGRVTDSIRYLDGTPSP